MILICDVIIISLLKLIFKWESELRLFFFHHLDEIIEEKTRWELFENVVCCFEQMFEAAT